MRSLLIGLLLSAPFFPGLAADLTHVGVARVDVTPGYRVPLSGYGNRTNMSTGVEQQIWAKALAFNPGSADVAVLITVDNCGVPFHVRREVLRRLRQNTAIKRERFAILSSHTHSAPMLNGVLENIFSRELTPAERAAMNRYTDDLTKALVEVTRQAIAKPIEAKTEWAIGKARMAENRRYGSGPTDDDLPVLRVTDLNGRTLAILANYACHCTAISGRFNRICGDWAGYTQEFLEERFPGSTAMIAIGCAGDQRPAARFGLEYAKSNGRIIADAVADTLDGTLLPVNATPACATEEIVLPLGRPRPRSDWENLAKSSNRSFAYTAQKNLRRLKRGEELQQEVPYMVQSWGFGDDLLMVFLPGEVLVDYAVRLKHKYDPQRTWVNAYANDVPCYIPSERILREGGYEGETAMRYYDRPERFAPGIERRILTAVAKTVPDGFENLQSPRRAVPPTTANSHFTTKPGHYVQLVAAEPQVVDPVAIDFGLDGCVWVAEMNDYPTGMDGEYQPGGRVKILRDKDGDGFFESAGLFLDNIPFPTGVTAWGDGVLVCAAPDILYAVDRNGDGRADEVKKLFTGFATDNYQARVNGIELGLDGWLYGSGGLRGGKVINLNIPSSKSITVSSADFRFSTDYERFEVAAGLSQQGRVRDDWGNWFGNNNSSSLFGYPFHRHYRNRNPYVFLPADRVYIPAGDEPERIYPTAELETRFNRPSHYNRVTSGCGIGIHRDSQIGRQFYGDAFICEPVHSVVRRLVLKADGPKFTGHRAADEQASEFLSSTDNWFRPAQVKTGPDGALWVVDMHRGLIEHPRWITEERLREIDVRAGADAGRIYRVLPSGSRVRKIPDLTQLSGARLVSHLESPNGTLRDLIHRELVFRRDESAVPALRSLFCQSRSAVTRLYSLCTLDTLAGDDIQTLLKEALQDSDPHVRRHAIRISERFSDQESVRKSIATLGDDPDPYARYQLALSLGNWPSEHAALPLAKLAVKDMGRSWNRTAVLSSARHVASEVFRSVSELPTASPGRSEILAGLFATIAATAEVAELGRTLQALVPQTTRTSVADWQLLDQLQTALERRRISPEKFLDSEDADVRAAALRLKELHRSAGREVSDSGNSLALRRAAIRLAGRGFNSLVRDFSQLGALLMPEHPLELQRDALAVMARSSGDEIPDLLLKAWPTLSPVVRREVVTTLIRRDPWIVRLLDAVESGVVSAAEIDHLSRLRISRRPDQKIAGRGLRLIPPVPASSRVQIVKDYGKSLRLNGDAIRGRSVFQQNCASCHAVGGVGVDVGPQLEVYRNKNARDLLAAILNPNSVIEPRFTNYEIETRDGESHAGIIRSESTAGITLLQAQGMEKNITRSEIASIRASTLSLMPEGLEQAIDHQQMADLIAFLKSTP